MSSAWRRIRSSGNYGLAPQRALISTSPSVSDITWRDRKTSWISKMFGMSFHSKLWNHCCCFDGRGWPHQILILLFDENKWTFLRRLMIWTFSYSCWTWATCRCDVSKSVQQKLLTTAQWSHTQHEEKPAPICGFWSSLTHTTKLKKW